MKTKPLVSVIIPTKNSEKNIAKCLESVKNQNYPNIEVLIVDGLSTDKTKNIAKRYGAKIIESDAKRSQARNIGAKRAKGEFLLFVDSDMELNLDVIDQCVKKTEKGYDGIIIPEVSVGEGFWAKCKALEKLCYIGDDIIEAARFFKREAFEAVNGYDEELEAGEDWDLTQRIKKAGFKVGRISALIKHHEGKLRLQETVRRKYQYGKTIYKYMSKHPQEARIQFNLIRPAFRKKWRILARRPVMLLGMSLMKLCEFIAGGIGMLTHKFVDSVEISKVKNRTHESSSKAK